MASTTFIEIKPKDGIQRDGTSVDSLQYIDGQWVRFYKNRALKMGGYKVISLGSSSAITNLYSFDSLNSILLYYCQANKLSVSNVYTDLSTTVPIDRTPDGFVYNPNNTWSIATVAYTVSGVITDYIIATACPNGSDIGNDVPGIVYYGQMEDTSLLTPLLSFTTTGGVVVLGSYIMLYGDNGGVFFNDGADINTFPDVNFIQFGSSKIVYAAPVRQNGVVTGLFWALDYVFSLTFNASSQGNETFTPAYVSTSSTILSAGSVVTFDPLFYWIGINNFYVFNGAVNPLANETNKLWFFENLNINYKELVTGFYNKKYNEVCWLAPMFGSTVNNWMIIYNVETGAWYDTPLTRSCAVSSSSQMQYPIMASSSLENINGSYSFPIWAHEFGVNKVDPIQTTAIVSSFTTSKFWTIDNNPEAQVLILDAIIPDVQQVNDMFFTVGTQGYPNSPVVTSNTFVMTPTTEFLTVRVKGSIMNLTFTSNVVDGNYLFGKTMIRLIVSDDQRPGPSTT